MHVVPVVILVLLVCSNWRRAWPIDSQSSFRLVQAEDLLGNDCRCLHIRWNWAIRRYQFPLVTLILLVYYTHY